jgi:hypothetical protein
LDWTALENCSVQTGLTKEPQLEVPSWCPEWTTDNKTIRLDKVALLENLAFFAAGDTKTSIQIGQDIPTLIVKVSPVDEIIDLAPLCKRFLHASFVDWRNGSMRLLERAGDQFEAYSTAELRVEVFNRIVTGDRSKLSFADMETTAASLSLAELVHTLEINDWAKEGLDEETLSAQNS